MRRTWPLRTRAAAAAIATSGLALLAAGCGSSQASHVAQLGSTTTQRNSPSRASAQALAFSHCMRSRGVPSFPDPGRGGAIPKVGLQQLGVDSSRFQAAQRACQHLLPNGGSGPTPAQVQYVTALALRFSPCMRAHGVPSFPDPDSTGRIPDPESLGIDQGSPKFEAANQACRKYRPPYIPSNSAYNAYARTHGS